VLEQPFSFLSVLRTFSIPLFSASQFGQMMRQVARGLINDMKEHEEFDLIKSEKFCKDFKIIPKIGHIREMAI